MEPTFASTVLLIIGFISALGATKGIVALMRWMRRDRARRFECERLYSESEKLPEQCEARVREQMALAKDVLDKIAEREGSVKRLYEEYRGFLRQQAREKQTPRLKELERQVVIREKAEINLLKEKRSVWASLLSEWEKIHGKWEDLDQASRPRSLRDDKNRMTLSAEELRRLPDTVRKLSERRAKEVQLARKHERMRADLFRSWVDHDNKIEDEKETHRRKLERNRKALS